MCARPFYYNATQSASCPDQHRGAVIPARPAPRVPCLGWGLQLWGIRLQVDSWPVPDVIPNRLRLLISRRILLSFVKLP